MNTAADTDLDTTLDTGSSARTTGAARGPGPERRRLTRRIAAAGVGVMVLASCTSDPGPLRVAEDIVRAEAARDPDLDLDCLLTVLDRFTDQDLRDIESDLGSQESERNADGETALGTYTLLLEGCR
ncbi:MAG: hypothetical protein AAGG08_03570 [Actinomycetota bacterium]